MAAAMDGLSLGMACTAPGSASLTQRCDITFEWDFPRAGLLESVDFSLAEFLGQVAEKKSLHCGDGRTSRQLEMCSNKEVKCCGVFG